MQHSNRTATRGTPPSPTSARRRHRRTRTAVVVALSAALLAVAVGLIACSGVAPTLTRGITAMSDGAGDAGGIAGGDAGGDAPTDGPFGAADGVMEDNTHSAFDTEVPGIANLDEELLSAVQAASDAAVEDDITLYISSGWRSTAYQQHLLDEAIREYGSEAAARQYVATPEVSSHTRGAAVDIGATDADYWLIQYGAEFGLCQTYANEIWHFELATVPGGECPAQLPDAG